MERRITPKGGAAERTRDAAGRDKRRNYRSLMNQMQEGVAILRMHPLRIVFATKSLASMTGYSVRALTSLSPEKAARLIHPADRATVLGRMRRGLRGGEASPVSTCRIVRKDGTTAYVDISSRKATYEGRPAVQATFINRTPRARLSLLSRAVEQIAEGVAMVTMDGTVIYTNRAFSAMHGYGNRSMEGEHLSIFHTPAQMPAVKVALKQTKTAGHYSGEIWHARRDGTCFPALMQTSLLRDESGRASGMVGTCRDITELKNTADELARSKEERSLILDSVEEPIAYKDTRLRVIWANRAALRRAGASLEEIIGRRCHEVWQRRARPCPGCPCLLAMRTGQPSWGESTDTSGRRFALGGYPVKNSQGKITGCVEVMVGSDNRLKVEEMNNLRSFSKMLIDIQEEDRRRIALELHDQVGQSLTATKLCLQRIEREYRRSGHGVICEFADAIALIEGAVNDVRTISRRLRPPSLDILGLVPSLKQLMSPLKGTGGVEIDFSVRGIRGRLDARIEIALYRVVQEALNNALKYSGCTRIEIALRAKRGKIALRVEDDGSGFSPLRANRMTGLGLTGMRERIEGVGGTFAVRSGPGRGTSISALVPLPATARRIGHAGRGS